mgnify:CR=1 FL=1
MWNEQVEINNHEFCEEFDNIVLDEMHFASDELMLEGRENSVIKSSDRAVPSPTVMPAMLLFRRVAYRQYPNKQVVALYYSKLVNKYLSVPFGPDGNLNLSEAVVLDNIDEGVLSTIAKPTLAGHVAGTALGGVPGAVVGTLGGLAYGAGKAIKGNWDNIFKWYPENKDRLKNELAEGTFYTVDKIYTQMENNKKS